MRPTRVTTVVPERSNEAALTLVELMVTMLLAGMLVAGLFYMMAGQTTTYRTQINTVTLQENLWGAMEFAQRHVRSAGFGFAPSCVGSQVRQWNGNSSGGCGTVPAFSAFRVFNDCNLLTTTPASCPDGSGSDTLMIVSASSGDGAALSQRALSSAGPLMLGSPAGIRANDLLVISSQGSDWCTIVRATSDPVRIGTEFQVSLNADSTYNTGAACNAFPAAGPGYAERSMVARFDPAEGPRYIAVDRSKGAPRLVTWSTFGDPPSNTGNQEVIANMIEDMQVAFGCDDNNDGVVLEGTGPDERQNDEWALNRLGGESTPPVCNPAPIRIVRLTLVARSTGPDATFKTGHRPGAEDRLPGTVAEDLSQSGGIGTFHRRTLTTLVRLRNL